MRNPSPEFLREQALKIAEYKSPGMWVLMEKYQKFAEELKAQAAKEAPPDQAALDTSADATPEPEAQAAVGHIIALLHMRVHAIESAIICA